MMQYSSTKNLKIWLYVYSWEPGTLRLFGAAQHGNTDAPSGPEGRDELGALRELPLPQAGRPLARRQAAQDQL